MPDNPISLIRAARSLANVYTDVDLARFLGISRRTVLRHRDQGGIPSGAHFDKLIVAVHPLDPDLARRLAHAFGRDLGSLGLPAPSLPPGKSSATAEHVATVLVAASDAFGMVPREVRPALRAVLVKIRDLGLNPDQLIALLAAPPQAEKT